MTLRNCAYVDREVLLVLLVLGDDAPWMDFNHADRILCYYERRFSIALLNGEDDRHVAARQESDLRLEATPRL